MQSISTWGYCLGPHINCGGLVQGFHVISAVRRDDSIVCLFRLSDLLRNAVVTRLGRDDKPL